MNVLVGVDSFKGSASSAEINHSIKKGLEAVGGFAVKTLPIADGGEGTIEALLLELGGKILTVPTFDSLMNPIKAEYLLTEINGEKTAIIESAKCLGINLNQTTEENFVNGTSFGLGVMLKEVLKADITQIIVALGGTATADGGLGLLEALGYKVISRASNNNKLFSFQSFDKVDDAIDFSAVNLIGATDVTATMLNKENSFIQFNAQKGSTSKLDAKLLEQAEKLIAEQVDKFSINVEGIPGSGAAGGIGGSLAILGGTLMPGFELLNRALQIEKYVKRADWIITGEGRLDGQTEHGKAPYALAQLAKKYTVPITAICGGYTIEALSLLSMFDGFFTVQREPVSLEQAMDKKYLLENVENISKSLGILFNASK